MSEAQNDALQTVLVKAARLLPPGYALRILVVGNNPPAFSVLTRDGDVVVGEVGDLRKGAEKTADARIRELVRRAVVHRFEQLWEGQL